MNPTRKAYLQIHTAVLLFGITAILGKLIVLKEAPLVWHRMWISSLGLVFLPGVIKGIRQMSRKQLLTFAGIGCIVATHWLTFYGSIKLGDNASVTLACLATASLFTAILEPIITGSKFLKEEIFLGLCAIVGIYLVVDVGEFYYKAIAVGLLSAFLAALFSTLNKKNIKDVNVLSVSTLELASGWVFMSIVIPFYMKDFSIAKLAMANTEQNPEHLLFGLSIHPFWYILTLGLLCTSLAYVLSLKALKHLSAFSTNLVINLEPVYGILLAAWIFHEGDNLTLNFYIGTTIILAGVILHPYLVYLRRRRAKRRAIAG